MSTRITLLPLHTRREFCVNACQVASALAVGAVAGCGGSPSAPSTSATQLTSVASTVSGRVISVPVDGSSPLAAVGSAAIVQTSLGSFLLARASQDSIMALTATCTHEGCTVNGFGSGRFVCPCHGSEFATTGTVSKGPASRPLQQYATQFTGGVVSFTA
jgi:cytochrome b6-f complex iron-sulfur subunit